MPHFDQKKSRNVRLIVGPSDLCLRWLVSLVTMATGLLCRRILALEALADGME